MPRKHKARPEWYGTRVERSGCGGADDAEAAPDVVGRRGEPGLQPGLGQSNPPSGAARSCACLYRRPSRSGNARGGPLRYAPRDDRGLPGLPRCLSAQCTVYLLAAAPGKGAVAIHVARVRRQHNIQQGSIVDVGDSSTGGSLSTSVSTNDTIFVEVKGQNSAPGVFTTGQYNLKVTLA